MVRLSFGADARVTDRFHTFILAKPPLAVKHWMNNINRVKMRGMAKKKKLPPDVLEYFRKQGAKGGKIGGKRSMETMTAEERSARARKASAARVAGRQKAKTATA